MIRLIKRLAVRGVGVVLLLTGIYVGLVMFYGREPWQESTVVRYGGTILAWVLGGAGLALMGYGSGSVAAGTDEDPGSHPR